LNSGVLFKKVTDVVGVTEATIRNRYKEIVREFGLEKILDCLSSRSHAREGSMIKGE
jgi:Transcription initiation factor IIB (TFIIB)